MSGGRYNRAFSRFQWEFVDELETKDNPKRERFKQLCELVATAMHDIEWVDSDDMGEGDEDAAIDAVFDFIKGKTMSDNFMVSLSEWNRIEENAKQLRRENNMLRDALRRIEISAQCAMVAGKSSFEESPL